MTESELLSFLRELAYLPLLGSDKASLFLTSSFTNTKTLVFLLHTEFGGETLVLTANSNLGYNKLIRYLNGQEPFFKIKDETITPGNKTSEFTLTIGNDDYQYKLNSVLTPDKEKFLKAKELGLNLPKNQLKQ